MADPIVAVSNLTFRYGSRTALDDLSLDVAPGEIFGFLGPNGSGKTTLFRILSTLVPAPDKTVRMFGLDVNEDTAEVRRRIGVVFQSPSIDRQLTAAENLRCHGYLYGLSGRDLEDRIAANLARVGLSDRAHDRTGTFSGGMRRRVELAKGLLNHPDVLLLDEPSTGLDPAARIDLWRALADVREAGVTVLVTTHLMDEGDKCDRLAVMAAGRLLACDAPAALKERIGGDVISVRSSDPVALDRQLRERLGVEAERLDDLLRFERPRGHEFVPRVIEAAPGLVDSISVGKPTLEDVFIRLTGQRLAIGDPNPPPDTRHARRRGAPAHA
jgi:ABC-2 type transport system ATP-binding protein